jgi:transcriptional regulator with XRE-family HTH domain
VTRVNPGQTGKDLGLVLRLLWWRHDWTQVELAERTGISIVQIRKLEGDEITRPQRKTWRRVQGGAGLRPEAVPTAASRLRELEAEMRWVLDLAMIQESHQPPKAELDTARIFGATF